MILAVFELQGGKDKRVMPSGLAATTWKGLSIFLVSIDPAIKKNQKTTKPPNKQTKTPKNPKTKKGILARESFQKWDYSSVALRYPCRLDVSGAPGLLLFVCLNPGTI